MGHLMAKIATCLAAVVITLAICQCANNVDMYNIRDERYRIIHTSSGCASIIETESSRVLVPQFVISCNEDNGLIRGRRRRHDAFDTIDNIPEFFQIDTRTGGVSYYADESYEVPSTYTPRFTKD